MPISKSAGLKKSVAGLSSKSRGFDPRPIHLGFEGSKVTM